MLQNKKILSEIVEIISSARNSAIRSVNHERTLMYWHIGKRIFEEEQQGEDRATYGEYLIKYLSENLQAEYGSGFSYRQLNWYRQFYKTFPVLRRLLPHS